MLAKPRSHPEAKRTRLAIFNTQEPGVIGWLCKCAIFYLDHTRWGQIGKRGRQMQALFECWQVIAW